MRVIDPGKLPQNIHDLHAAVLFMKALPRDLSDEDRDSMMQLYFEKHLNRRLRFSWAISFAMINEGPALVCGDTDERNVDWVKCLESIEDSWLASADLWHTGHYAKATALAIVTLEETGKIAVERIRLIGPENVPSYSMFNQLNIEEWKSRFKIPPFKDHRAKHRLAAMSGALLNPRLDRLFGIKVIDEFLEFVENDGPETLKQDCLYLDRKDGSVHSPLNAVDQESAARYIAIVGEILAAILSNRSDSHPKRSDYNRFIKHVMTFELSAGLPHK